jgi:ribosome maturation factor RimP
MVVEEKIYNLLKDAVSDLGYDIVRVKHFDQSKILQIMIENKNGQMIGVEDCERVSNTVSLILDVDDPISSDYNLEVSSAGLDRPLVRIEDFVKFKGREVKIKLSNMVDGVRNFKGIIEEIVANNIVMKLDTNQMLHIDFDNISSANLTIDIKKLFNNKRTYG